MPTYRGGKSSKGKKGSKAGAKAGKKSAIRPGKNVAPSTDPIIITGGSLKLEYANRTKDGFKDNGSGVGSGMGKVKLKHKKDPEAFLTTVDFRKPGTTTPLFTIDLVDLGINRACEVVINYTYDNT